MEPMPPLEGAVYPPRVEPPTWADTHPQMVIVLRLIPAVAMTILSVLFLKRDGFSWLWTISLAAWASNIGYYLAKLEGPDEDEPS
ncbi:hypothetical protein V6K52_01220 [Knoellia sp. S7-12]|uniref:hypothetical protein n=1 Tax=Knoellia sp. S7-12 TaxID=3126698 RepID=UPI0033662AC6